MGKRGKRKTTRTAKPAAVKYKARQGKSSRKNSAKKKAAATATVSKKEENRVPWIPKPEPIEGLEPEAQSQSSGKGLSRLKSIFKFGKKTKDDELKIPKLEMPEAPQAPAEIEIEKPAETKNTKAEEEPEILKSIDIEEHNAAVEPELALWLSDGRVVRSLIALKDALTTMKEKVYVQHTAGRNEISGWVGEVLGNRKLAAELESAKSKNDACKTIERYLKSGKTGKPKTQKQEMHIQEIETAIKNAIKKKETKAQPKKAVKENAEELRQIPKGTLEAREKELEELERGLDEEEEQLNRKKLELSRRRYEFVKARGELEREKFDEFMKEQKKLNMEQIASGNDSVAMPELELTEEYTKGKVEELITGVRHELMNGNSREAERKMEELKAAMLTAYIPADEKRRMEYKILELETDVKLAALT